MKKLLGFLGILSVVASVGAAEPPQSTTASQSAGVPAIAGPNLTLEVGNTAEVLHQLSEDEAKAAAQLRLAKIRSELEVFGVGDENERGGGAPGSSARKSTGVPELVGISGRIGNLQAEFVVGSAIVRVGPGDSVTDRVRVISVDSDGVLVESDGNRQRLFFGRAAPVAAPRSTVVSGAPPPGLVPPPPPPSAVVRGN